VVQSHQTGQGERGFYILRVKTFNKILKPLFDWTIRAKMSYTDQPAAQEKAMLLKFIAMM